MELLSTFAGTRRSRRRQAAWSMVRWSLLAVCLLGGAVASYRVGVSQSRTEISRLSGDIDRLQELNRLMSERAARAEQQAEAAITRYAQLQRVYRSEVPSGELRELLDLAAERLKSGVPAARLRFLLRAATAERRCDRETETKRVPIHTPVNTGPVGTVGVANDRITVSGEGMAARNADGAPEAWFDPAQPVTLRFLKIDGDVSTIEGKLPLTHALVLQQAEYLFSIKASEKQPGQIDIITQRCAYP
jgi:hypothetical protein